MSIELIIMLSILFLVAMFFTFYAFKQEEIKVKKYEEEGITPEEELKRSHEYELNSISTYIPIQVWMYVITTIISIFIILYFLNLVLMIMVNDIINQINCNK